MSKINITITAPLKDFSVFADELGYQSKVSKTAEELALLVEPISIQDRLKDNPQTKQQFLEVYFKNFVVSELFRKKSDVIDRQIYTVKESEKDTLRTVLTNVVSVSSTI